jgi:hypothetical protein
MSGLSVEGVLWTWKISPNAFATYALERFFKHTKMRAYRVFVLRDAGK